jgi:citrate synthase
MLGIRSAARGLDGVVAARTRLSDVDGVNGRLRIAGYELEELAGAVTFEEAAQLLWTGQLPTAAEARKLSEEMATLRELPNYVLNTVWRSAERGASSIETLRTACSELPAMATGPDGLSRGAELANAKMLAARFPTIVAAHARVAAGREPIDPRRELSLASNFLYMLTGEVPDPVAARALDTYWVAMIDHGMNASTFTARVIASTRSDMLSAVTGALGALKGPLHGGAPAPVLEMLKAIGSAERAEAWVRGELAAGRRIMGFGHRLYRVRDPRAEVLSRVSEEMSRAVLHDRRLFDLARAVEATVLRVLEEVKPGRRLQTNVEFYTALVLQSLGLEPSSFVAMFACARCAGWCAHVMEQHGEDRLIRPLSEYVGPLGLTLANRPTNQDAHEC